MIATVESRNAFLEAFDRFEAAGGDEPGWLAPIRKAAIARFAEMGFPTRTDEEWRLTDVSPIAQVPFVEATDVVPVRSNRLRSHLWDDGTAHRLVFVNGRHAPPLTSLGMLPQGVIVGNLAAAFDAPDSSAEAHLSRYVDYQTQPFAALNTAFIRDGAFVYVPPNCMLERPIHVLHLSVPGTEPLAVHPRCLIVAEENAQLTLIETYATHEGGLHFTNPLTELVTGPGANVDHYKLQQESHEALHIGTLHIHQARDSNVRSHCLTFGGGLVRHNINAVLAGPGADCHLNGLYVTDKTQHVDNHLRVEHAAPHCSSREVYKGVLDDRSSGVFTGRIIVRQGALKTDGKQSNHNLLLSEHAHVDSKPQLEIFCDDVKCTHGATIGQLDRDALFYLRSRGLPEPAARNLLIQAFAGESLDQISVALLRRRLHGMLREWLAARGRTEELP